MVAAKRSAATPLTARFAQQLPGLIQHLGEQGLIAQLLAALDELMAVRHVAVATFDEQLVPHVIAAESAGNSEVAKSAGKIYERSLLYRHDPNVTLIRGQPADVDAAHNQPLLLRVKASDISDQEYRSKIYRRFGLIDRFSILDHSRGAWLAINLFRERDSGEFGAREVKFMEGAAGLIAALVAKHFAMQPALAEPTPRRPSVELFEQLVGALDPRLTARQVQVCARALMGMTNVAVGLDLGIQVPTVATLRKRAYATLEISSLNELFALCLSQTSHASREE